jgi:hypothetical protein
MEIRRQYHFRDSEAGLQAWDVQKLIARTTGLQPFALALAHIRELDEPYWNNLLTPRDVTNHVRLIQQCDLSYPIILCNEGRLMDGMHRVCSAVLQGIPTITAVQFERYVPPDYVGKSPEQLPY